MRICMIQSVATHNQLYMMYPKTLLQPGMLVHVCNPISAKGIQRTRSLRLLQPQRLSEFEASLTYIDPSQNKEVDIK